MEFYILDKYGFDDTFDVLSDQEVVMELIYVIIYCRRIADTELIQDEMIETVIDNRYFYEVSIRDALALKSRINLQLDLIESEHDIKGLILTDIDDDKLVFSLLSTFESYHKCIIIAFNKFYRSF